MRMIIDRFEGQLVVLEYQGRTYNLPKAVLPDTAKEGDVVDLVTKVDEETTQKRRQKISQLMEQLFED